MHIADYFAHPGLATNGTNRAGLEHYACVNRDELQRALEREGVRPTAYSLNADRLSDDVCCLAITPGGWSVWFAKRGERWDAVFFETEDEACDELLLRVMSDPTTRLR